MKYILTILLFLNPLRMKRIKTKVAKTQNELVHKEIVNIENEFNQEQTEMHENSFVFKNTEILKENEKGSPIRQITELTTFEEKFEAHLKKYNHTSLGINVGGIPFDIVPIKLDEFKRIDITFNTDTCSIVRGYHYVSFQPVTLKIYGKILWYKYHTNIKHEINFQLSINHTRIQKLYCAFIDNRKIVLVYEDTHYCDLRNYQYNMIKKFQSPIPLIIIKKFARDLLKGVDCLHKHGIVHRNIHPDNIYIDISMKIRIGDFTHCANMDDTFEMSQARGTYPFMAPEVSRCQYQDLYDSRLYNEKCDIWSIGMIIYECLIGYIPYMPLIYPTHLIGDSKEFLQRMLVYDPDKRASAEELLNHSWLRSIDITS